MIFFKHSSKLSRWSAAAVAICSAISSISAFSAAAFTALAAAFSTVMRFMTLAFIGFMSLAFISFIACIDFTVFIALTMAAERVVSKLWKDLKKPNPCP